MRVTVYSRFLEDLRVFMPPNLGRICQITLARPERMLTLDCQDGLRQFHINSKPIKSLKAAIAVLNPGTNLRMR
jgi:hypothetical protein